MKKFAILSVLAMATFSTAYASAPVTIQGRQAADLMQDLEAAGAVAHNLVDLSILDLGKLEASVGELPGSGPFASLTSSQSVFGPEGTQYVRLVKISASGDKAEAVFDDLVDAGVQPEIYEEMEKISVQSISCRAGMVPGGTRCAITQ